MTWKIIVVCSAQFFFFKFKVTIFFRLALRHFGMFHSVAIQIGEHIFMKLYLKQKFPLDILDYEMGNFA